MLSSVFVIIGSWIELGKLFLVGSFSEHRVVYDEQKRIKNSLKTLSSCNDKCSIEGK